jgi:peptidyl-prolyl cis-trans isomerase C
MMQKSSLIYAIVNFTLIGLLICLGSFAVYKSAQPDRETSADTTDMGGEHPADKVIVIVNGQNVTLADFELAREEVGDFLRNVPRDRQDDALIELLIERTLLAQDARKHNVQADKDVQRTIRLYTDYYENKVLRDVHLTKLARARVTEEKLRAQYDTEVEKFVPQEQVRARHILVASNEEAQSALEQIRSGTPFEDVARAVSKDGSAKDGGNLGYFVKEQMLEPFAEAAFALQPGEVSEPVQTQAGWHVIKLEDKRMQQVPRFEEAQDFLQTQVMRAEAKLVLEELRQAADVKEIGVRSVERNAASEDGADAPPPADQPASSPTETAP